MHESNGNGDGATGRHFPATLQSPESQALYQLVLGLGDALAQHSAAMNTRFDMLARGIRLEIASALGGGKPPSLPPMRPESPSSVVLLEQVKAEALETLRARAAQTPGSHVQAEPEDLAADVEALVAKALEARENASNAKFLKWQRGVAAAGVIAFVTAICGAAGLWAWGKAQHAEGFVEGKSHPAAAAAPAH